MQMTSTNHPHLKFRVINHEEFRFAFYMKNYLSLFRRLNKISNQANTSLRLGGHHLVIKFTIRRLDPSSQQINYQL